MFIRTLIEELVHHNIDVKITVISPKGVVSVVNENYKEDCKENSC